jgi:hypothetical protein
MPTLAESPVLSPRQEVLNLIPRQYIDYILKRNGIKKDLIIGLVGERGGGKSGSGAVLALTDFALNGTRLYSNMKISCEFEIDDATAREVGLRKGGIAQYKSLPIDMPKLLHFDEMYRNSIIFFDEINVEISEARRAMSNTNLFSNRLAQELRHLETSIIFTCISEMAVDPRWRDIVDIFIKSEETAYYAENIEAGKPRGVDFCWTVYLMNRCFNGHTYQETQQPIRNAIFHFKPWHGIYDDKEFQGAGMKKYGVQVNESVSNMNVSIQDAPNVVKDVDEWEWFAPIMKDIFTDIENGVDVPTHTIWNMPEVVARGIHPKTITERLRDNHIMKKIRCKGAQRIPYYTAELIEDTQTTTTTTGPQDDN